MALSSTLTVLDSISPVRITDANKIEIDSTKFSQSEGRLLANETMTEEKFQEAVRTFLENNEMKERSYEELDMSKSALSIIHSTNIRIADCHFFNLSAPSAAAINVIFDSSWTIPWR